MINIKRKILKRIHPIDLIKYEIRKNRKGSRSRKTAAKYGPPIDCMGSDHLHIYMTLRCRFNCHFCINRILTGQPVPKFEEHPFTEWLNFLNRLYNIRELYFNGGEHFMFKDFDFLINGLDNFNIIIFSNLPPQGMDMVRVLRKNNNNIIIKSSYHPLQEGAVNIFVEKAKQVPADILHVPHIIKTPGVSFGMYKDQFLRCGIHVGSDELVYDVSQRSREGRPVWCKTNEHQIGPDMRFYKCLVHFTC